MTLPCVGANFQGRLFLMWFHASTTRSHKIEVDLFGNDIIYIYIFSNLWPKCKVGEKGGLSK